VKLGTTAFSRTRSLIPAPRSSTSTRWPPSGAADTSRMIADAGLRPVPQTRNDARQGRSRGHGLEEAVKPGSLSWTALITLIHSAQTVARDGFGGAIEAALAAEFQPVATVAPTPG
jgi:hypothetical protein